MCFIIIEFVSNGFYFMSATLQKPKGYLAIEHAATLVIIIEPFWDERVEYFFLFVPADHCHINLQKNKSQLVTQRFRTRTNAHQLKISEN